jgi:hypothetical protein
MGRISTLAHRQAAGLLGLVLALSVAAGCSSSKPAAQATPSPSAAASPQSRAATSPKDATYVIENKAVTLTNGLSEVEAAPGSASKVTTRYFGNEATGDLNGDGTADVGFVLTQTSGGSGTFYYAVVALKTSAGYVGTNAVLLGDRIAPQTTEVRDGQLIVNYADRKQGEPFTTPPSVGVSKFLKVVEGKLVER